MKLDRKNVRMFFTHLELVEMGESRTTPSGFFEALDTWDDGLIAPEKGIFCLSVSMGCDPCMLVKR